MILIILNILYISFFKKRIIKSPKIPVNYLFLLKSEVFFMSFINNHLTKIANSYILPENVQ